MPGIMPSITNVHISGYDSSRESSPQPPITRAQAAAQLLNNSNPDCLEEGDNGDGRSSAYLREFQDNPYPSVGPQFQAMIPDCDPVGCVKEYEKDDRKSICLWVPPLDVSKSWNNELDKYISDAQNIHGYSYEQALMLLKVFDHDFERAKSRMADYRPLPSNWTHQDSVLFDQAYTFNGKIFRRIQQMMPLKTVQELVQHYYSSKNKRSRQVSYVEYQHERKRKFWRQDSPEDVREPAFEPCSNCNFLYAQLQDSPKGRLCAACCIHLRRTNQLPVPNVNASLEHQIAPKFRSDSAKETRLPCAPNHLMLNVMWFLDHLSPKDPNLKRASIWSLREAQKKRCANKVLHFKALAQKNKAVINKLHPSKNVQEGIQERLYDISHLRLNHQFNGNVSSEWSMLDRDMAVLGFGRYGKDFEAIADVVGTKTADDIEKFYEDHAEELVETLSRFEKEQKEYGQNREEKNVEEIVIDD